MFIKSMSVWDTTPNLYITINITIYLDSILLNFSLLKEIEIVGNSNDSRCLLKA